MKTNLQIGMHADCAGGVERYVDGLCRAFDRAAVPYRGIVFGRGGEPDLPAGTRILGAADAPLRERWRLIREAARESLSSASDQPMVVASHFALYGWPVMALRRGGARMVSHFHGPWAAESAAEGQSQMVVWAKHLLERRVYRGSTWVVSDSEAFRRVAIERYGLPADKVVAVHAGVDVRPIMATVAPHTRTSAREMLGWPTERRILFSLRRLIPRMGLENLIDAVGALVPDHPEVFLVIGGKGPSRRDLEARVERLGLGNHVTFAGYIPESDLPVAYRAAEATVLPSVALEGFGLVILESMAAGTPVLVTPVGGMPEVMRPFRPDCVFSGSGVEDLVKGIRTVLTGEQQLPEAAACLEHVKRRHDWDDVARQLLRAYAGSNG